MSESNYPNYRPELFEPGGNDFEAVTRAIHDHIYRGLMIPPHILTGQTMAEYRHEREEKSFTDAIAARPRDGLPWLMFADWLEEHNQPTRAREVRRRGHLLPVLTFPDDDGPREEFARWCEEVGETARAYLIRLQLALEPLRTHGHGFGKPHGGGCRECNRAALMERDERLAFNRLTVGFPELNYLFAARNGQHPQWFLTPDSYNLPPGASVRALLRRGFVESVTLPAADWLRLGDRLVSDTPIRDVRLTNWDGVNIHARDMDPAHVVEYRFENNERPRYSVQWGRLINNRMEDGAALWQEVAQNLMRGGWPNLRWAWPGGSRAVPIPPGGGIHIDWPNVGRSGR